MASNPHRWRILAVVATAFFMTILDVSIVNVALPSIGKDLNFSQENLQWVITAYAIAFGGFLLHGRLARLRSRAERGNADRLARGAGLRRRDHLPGRALDRDDELRGRPGTQQ